MVKFDLQLFASARCADCPELRPSTKDDIVALSAQYAGAIGLSSGEYHDFMVFLLKNPAVFTDKVFSFIDDTTADALKVFRNEKERNPKEL